MTAGLLVSWSPGLLVGLFPRGPGFYFDPVKLVVLLVIYFSWVRTCSWVDHDAEQLKLPRLFWNLLLFGCGLVGLIVVWLLPWFWISCIILLFLYRLVIGRKTTV